MGRKEGKFPFETWHFGMAERAADPRGSCPSVSNSYKSSSRDFGCIIPESKRQGSNPHHKSCSLKLRYIILLALLSVGLFHPFARLCSANRHVLPLFVSQRKPQLGPNFNDFKRCAL